MAYKFEKLEVWALALDYADAVYAIAGHLPERERFNLASQITRAATSVALNIAEGSTGQSDSEQARFLGYAIRSLVETVACLHLIRRRGYLDDPSLLRDTYRQSETLFKKLQAFRSSFGTLPRRVREGSPDYDSDSPF
jgi:four helix bundle protein